MHLNVRLPKVEPLTMPPPTHCPLQDRKHPKKRCPGTHFKEHQWNCRKPLRDTQHTQVTARRYRCLKCNRTFRIYPTGVSHLHQSETLKGLSVLLYILGLRYQGVSDLLDTLGFFLSKTTVYNNVQAASLWWLKTPSERQFDSDCTPRTIRRKSLYLIGSQTTCLPSFAG